MKLGFSHNNKIEKKIRIDDGVQIMIGRSPSSDVVLPFQMISSYHAQLLKDHSGKIYIIDQNSTNGTFVNNRKITPHTPQLISPGDRVTLSNNNGVEIVFNPDTSISTGSPPGGSGRGSFSFDSKSQTDLLTKLRQKKVIFIGRGKDADVILDHPTISRLHASIEMKENGTYVIKDLGSTNGTFLNGKRVSTSNVFNENDTIFIGRFKLSLNTGPKDLSNEIAIRANRISKVYRNNKVGLHETTLDIPSNIFLAVMGPSGCGKSTLLKALNGASPSTSGNVFICGLELTQNYDYLKTQIGYVPQDDIVHTQLTVEESLWYAAKLRLQNFSEQKIQDKITQVLESLKIGHIRDQPVGEISGGQRKRVSIAVELLNDPMILFLDEPTSPLDPETIEEFLDSLRGLCDKGTTVVIVTHKPEDLNYVDTVIFMAQGGRMAYYGSTKSYLNYFEVPDTVKVYSSLTGERANKWVNKFNKEYDRKYDSEPTIKQMKSSGSVNYFSQYWWLTRRYFNIKLNDRLNSSIMVMQAPLIAFLICIIYERIEISVPFLLTISAVWFGTNNAAREIVGELPIYMRERMFNQGILPYIFSKITVLGTFAAIQSLLFTFIISIVYHSNDSDSVSWGDPFMTFIWMHTLSVAATILGLLLSSIVSNTEKVMTIVPLALIPQIMLAGIVAKIEKKLIEILSYVTFSRWGTEGFSNIQEKVVVKTLDTYTKTDAVQTLKQSFHPTLYQDIFGSYYTTFKLDFIAVSVLALIFLILTCAALKAKDTIKIKI